jgi:ssDNA-binding Zn-finger/Zn-ribbon topoisomerase 1
MSRTEIIKCDVCGNKITDDYSVPMILVVKSHIPEQYRYHEMTKELCTKCKNDLDFFFMQGGKFPK